MGYGFAWLSQLQHDVPCPSMKCSGVKLVDDQHAEDAQGILYQQL